MKLREYAKQKRDVKDKELNEGFYCPCDFDLPDMCKDGCGDCEKCWNREIPETPAPMTAEEAWEIAKQVALTTNMVETARIFIAKNICGIEQKRLFEDVFALTPQEAKAKLEEWESKQIHVGDVVYCFADCDDDGWRNNEENYGVVTGIYPNTYHVLMKNGDCADFEKDELEKTGKHIDIQSVLDQIGGGKDE